MSDLLSPQLEDFLRHEFAREAKFICLSGAGISNESGIPTFRGKDGLWEKYDFESYAYMEGLLYLLKKKPKVFGAFVRDLYSVLCSARPNPAHAVLSSMEKSGILKAVITQNVDNLHQDAGNRTVVELHGNAFRIRCMKCGITRMYEKERLKEMGELLCRSRLSRSKFLRIISRYFPRCKQCGGRFRIDIVLFGEQLPEHELAAAYTYVSSCDVLFIVGSSLVVYPAAGLPVFAKKHGVRLIEINKEPSVLSDVCDFSVRGTAVEAMTQILQLAKM